VRAPQQLYICIGTTSRRSKAADKVDGDIDEQIDLGPTKIAVEAARSSELRPHRLALERRRDFGVTNASALPVQRGRQWRDVVARRVVVDNLTLSALWRTTLRMSERSSCSGETSLRLTRRACSPRCAPPA
jgi:hypothetical protein